MRNSPLSLNSPYKNRTRAGSPTKKTKPSLPDTSSYSQNPASLFGTSSIVSNSIKSTNKTNNSGGIFTNPLQTFKNNQPVDLSSFTNQSSIFTFNPQYNGKISQLGSNKSVASINSTKAPTNNNNKPFLSDTPSIKPSSIFSSHIGLNTPPSFSKKDN